MPSQVLTKRRVKRRQQRLRVVSKNAKRKVRSSVRKHRKTAKKVMRGGIMHAFSISGSSPVSSGYSSPYDDDSGDSNKRRRAVFLSQAPPPNHEFIIMADNIRYSIRRNNLSPYQKGPARPICKTIIPIFIIVRFHREHEKDDLYLLFHKNTSGAEIEQIVKFILGLDDSEILIPEITVQPPTVDDVVDETKLDEVISIVNTIDINKQFHEDDQDKQLKQLNQLRELLTPNTEPFKHISKTFVKLSGTFRYSISSGVITDFETDIQQIPTIEHKTKSKSTSKLNGEKVWREQMKIMGDYAGMSGENFKRKFGFGESNTLLPELYQNYLIPRLQEEAKNKNVLISETVREKTIFDEDVGSWVKIDQRTLQGYSGEIKYDSTTVLGILNGINNDLDQKSKIRCKITELPQNFIKQLSDKLGYSATTTTQLP